MEHFRLSNELSKTLGISEEEALVKLEKIAANMAYFCGECDSVSIPGFGTFQSEKKEEDFTIDSKGNMVLNPPAIEVDFKPSVVLRKSLS